MCTSEIGISFTIKKLWQVRSQNQLIPLVPLSPSPPVYLQTADGTVTDTWQRLNKWWQKLENFKRPCSYLLIHQNAYYLFNIYYIAAEVLY